MIAVIQHRGPQSKVNLETTASGSLLLPLRIEDIKVTTLLDCGSTICVVHPDLLLRCAHDKDVEVTDSAVTLKMANGELVSVFGEARLQVQLTSDLVVEHKFVVADIESPAIIGLDLLRKYGAVIDVKNNMVEFEGNPVACAALSDAVSTSAVALMQDIMVPAGSEMVLPGRLTVPLPYMLGVIEADPELEVAELILVGKSLCDLSKDVLPVRVANLGTTPARLRKGMKLAHCSAVSEVVPDKPTRTPPAPEEPPDSGSRDDDDFPAFLVPMIESIGDNVSKVELKAIKKLLKECQDAFSKDKDDLGYCDWVEHEINIVPGGRVRERFRRLPLSKYQDAKKETQRLLDMGVIVPSKSDFASPIVLVAKPNGGVRFCLDYRRLNELTIKDNYPLPRITETIDSLRGSCFFSTLDMNSGYWQVKLKDSHRHRTAFTTRWGLYEWLRMPMGLMNAGSTFQRLMDRVLAGLSWEICLCYLDDVIVFAGSFIQHLDRLREVLIRLKNAGLKLSTAKCFLFRLFVKFLGHIVSKDGVACDPDKVSAIKKWPVPANVSELRSFLGLCSYYRRFCPSFATLAAPLYRLTEARTDYTWDQQCTTAFEGLKSHLCSPPILAYPLDDGEFLLDTDASLVGLGAVLSQIQNEEERVIAYYSRSLTKPERNYCVTRLELLAVVNAVKHFHHYLYGRKFVVRTDHASLKWLMNFKEPEGQLARFLEVLSMYYPFEVEHRQGTYHGNADGLSRRPCRDCDYCDRVEQKDDLKPDVAPKMVCVVDTEIQENYSLVTPWSAGQLKAWQEEDMLLRRVRQWVSTRVKPDWADMRTEGRFLRIYYSLFDSLKMMDEVLYIQMETGPSKGKARLVVPEAVRKQIFQHLHLHRLGGHLGETKVVAKAMLRFWWPGMKQDLARWIQFCDRCQRRKRRPGRGCSPLHQVGVGSPMERIAFDILAFPQATDDGHTCVLVVCDYFTKWVEAFALKDHQAVTVAEILVEEIFLRYGIPHYLHSDRAPEFMSSLMREICSLLEINRTATTPYNPRSDGLVERFNRTLIDMLAKFVGEHKSDWNHHLKYVLAAYRAARNDSTGCSPNLLMLGREVTMPVDLMFLNPTEVTYRCQNEYAEWVRAAILENFELARSVLKGAALRQKRLYDRNTAPRCFKVGQWVLRFYPPLRNKDKLNSPFIGPYLIVGQPGDVTYLLQETKDSEPFAIHADHLKLYYSEEPRASWLSENQEGMGENQLADEHADDGPEKATVRVDVNDAPMEVNPTTTEAPAGNVSTVPDVSTPDNETRNPPAAERLRRGTRRRRVPERFKP